MAGVVGHRGAAQALDHVALIQGSHIWVPQSALQILASQNVTLTLKSPAKEQYVLRVHEGSALGPTMITAVLPWSSPPTQVCANAACSQPSLTSRATGVIAPRQVNVWRGAHVWHVANTSLGSGELKPVIKFEALAGLDYLIERQCIRSMKAGCGRKARAVPPLCLGTPCLLLAVQPRDMTVARGPDQAPRATA